MLSTASLCFVVGCYHTTPRGTRLGNGVAERGHHPCFLFREGGTSTIEWVKLRAESGTRDPSQSKCRPHPRLMLSSAFRSRRTAAFWVLEPALCPLPTALGVCPGDGSRASVSSMAAAMAAAPSAIPSKKNCECVSVGDDHLLIRSRGVDLGTHGNVWAGPQHPWDLTAPQASPRSLPTLSQLSPPSSSA